MKVSKKLKITNIQIDLEGKDPLILTIDEAKELHEALDEFFGKEEKIKIVPIEKSIPSYPIPRDQIWYSDSSNKSREDSRGFSLDPESPL